MIRASELRIGNWIRNNVTGNNIKVGYHEIRYLSIWPDESKRSGIPLTPEILEKCGFEKYQWQDALFLKTPFGDLYIHFFQGRIITRIVNVTKDSKGQKMVSLPFVGNKKTSESYIYLHRLQNLIFALTGEELTVNL